MDATTNTLNGLFSNVYKQKMWQGGDFVGIVHPLTYKRLVDATNKLKGASMVTQYETDKCEGVVQDSPLLRELANRKYAVKELRESISRKQEELRIALAILAAVKKLSKGDK